MTIKSLAQRLRSLADLLDTVDSELTGVTLDLNVLTAMEMAIPEGFTAAPKLHWTKRPENATKLARIQKKRLATRAKNARSAKAVVAKRKRDGLHWTQRPENKTKVRRMNRKSAKLRLVA
jgi:hypothetical protein